jgi:hypothetical protein
LVDELVDPIPSSVNTTLPLESEFDTTQVLLFTIDSSRQCGISPISSEPPPSIEVISFDWNRLMDPCLPSYLHFQIIVYICDKNIYRTIIDKGASIIILSSTSWQYIGSPHHVSVTHHLMVFNRKNNEPLGILPHLPITLGGKTFCIDIMVV